MSANWDFYQCTVENKSASVALHLDLKDSAPDLRRPVLLMVSLKLHHPDPRTGLSTEAEFDLLASIEDHLSQAFRDNYAAVQAGRMTTDGRRDFYYYCAAAPDLDAVAAAALAPFPGYACRAWLDADPQWRRYLEVLYPDRAAQRWIKDKAVIEALAGAGDDASMLRPARHFSTFSNATHRAAFAAAIENAGFTVRSMTERGGAGEPQPFGLIYELPQLPQLAAMSATTLLLTRLAEKNGGRYDGWESPVTRGNARAWWRFWA